MLPHSQSKNLTTTDNAALSRSLNSCAAIPNNDNHARMVDVLDWVAQRYPELELRIAWNQPMFARQPWDKPFDYELLDAFIHHPLDDKQDITSFWRSKSR